MASSPQSRETVLQLPTIMARVTEDWRSPHRCSILTNWLPTRQGMSTSENGTPREFGKSARMASSQPLPGPASEGSLATEVLRSKRKSASHGDLQSTLQGSFGFQTMRREGMNVHHASRIFGRSRPTESLVRSQ